MALHALVAGLFFVVGPACAESPRDLANCSQADCDLHEVVLGIYGPITSISMTFLASAIAFDLDFRKNFDSTLVDRFGPPIISIPDLNEKLRIKVQIGNSNSEPDVGIAMALSMFQGQNGFDKVNGLVGGYHSGLSMPVNNLANFFQVPQIAWGSTTPKLSNKDVYKFFARTIPPDSLQGAIMWNAIKTFAIPSVAFFYAQEPYGEGLFQTVIDASALDGMSSRISGVGMTYMPRNYDYDEAYAKIAVAKSQGTKFIFLAMAADQGRPLWEVALRDDVGFGTTKVQFFGSEALGIATLGIEIPPLGYVYFSPVNQGPLFPKWQEMWKKMTPEDCVGDVAREYYRLNSWTDPNLTEGKKAVPTLEMFQNMGDVLQLEDPFIFDAAYTFVMAFNEMMNEGVPPAEVGGEPLLNKIYSAKFEGISGTVFFDANGDRYASFILNNVIVGQPTEKKPVVVATFDSSKLATGESAMTWVREEGILWQDGTQGKRIPATFTACEPGFMAVAEGEMCTKCHAGSFSLGGAMPCEDCPPGKTTNTGEALGATGCVDCKHGSIAKLPGSTICEDCPRGTVPNASSTICMRCAQGKFQDKVGGTKCKPCGGSMTTEYQGAEKLEDCKCIDGFYAPRSDFSANLSCAPCPKGMTCSLGSDMANYYAVLDGGASDERAQFPKLLPGRMSLASDPLWVYECKDEARCPGGNPGTCGPNLDTDIVSCAHCKPSWYWTGIRCKQCGDVENSGLIFPFLPFILAPVVIAGMYWLFRDDVAKWGTWQNGIASISFLMLNHYQMTSLANQANLDTPPRVTEYFSTFTWTDDLLLIFKPQCAGYTNFEESMVMRALGPMVGLVFVVLTYLGSHAVKMGTGKPVAMQSDRAVNVYFSCVFTFFAGIASMALSLFKCHDNPNGTYTLVRDESIHCFETRWNSMVVVAVVAVLVYILGFGALFVYIICVGPQNFHDVRFQRRWKFLFIKYRPDVWWWAIALVTRGVIMNVGYIFFALGVQQLFWIMSVVFVYAVLAVHYAPWRHRQANSVELYMLMAIMLALALLSWFAHGSAGEEVENIGTDIQFALMIVNISPAVLSLVLGYIMVRSQMNAIQRDQLCSKSNTMRQHVATIAQVPDEEFNMFLLSLDEWSVWHLQKAFAILAFEIAGNSSARKGLFPKTYFHSKTYSSDVLKNDDGNAQEGKGVGNLDAYVKEVCEDPSVTKPSEEPEMEKCPKNVPDTAGIFLEETTTQISDDWLTDPYSFSGLAYVRDERHNIPNIPQAAKAGLQGSALKMPDPDM